MVRVRQLVEVGDQRPDGVFVNPAVSLDPPVGDVRDRSPLAEIPDQVEHGVFAFADAGRVHPLLLDHLREMGRVRPAEHGQDGEFLLHLPVQPQKGPAIQAHRAEGEDVETARSEPGRDGPRFGVHDRRTVPVLLEKSGDTDDEDISIITEIFERAALNLQSRLGFVRLTSTPSEDIANEIINN